MMTGTKLKAELDSLKPNPNGASFEGYGETHQWTHIPCFWKLAYFKDLELPHNLFCMAEDGVKAGRRRLALQRVIHEAIIEVNEEGTEAAAATYGNLRPLRLTSRVDFVADHPFAFFLIEEVSGAILFAGHVADPSKC
jgi:hypothetical protein